MAFAASLRGEADRKQVVPDSARQQLLTAKLSCSCDAVADVSSSGQSWWCTLTVMSRFSGARSSYQSQKEDGRRLSIVS